MLLSRRDWLSSTTQGLLGAGLLSLLEREGWAEPQKNLSPPAPLSGRERGAGLHHPARAKRVVQFFMAGGASHLDLFDYKPALLKHHGEKSNFGEPVEAFQDGLGPWLKSPWEFKPYGQSGKMLSEIAAPLGSVVDQFAFVHNMVNASGVHSQGTLLQTTGFTRPGFPGMGCWISYGLGSLNDNLPTFVVLPDHRGYASNGTKNWDASFLPSHHSGTVIRGESKQPVQYLLPDKQGSFINTSSETATQQLLKEMNLRHATDRADDQRLAGRIASYELAARMQLAAPEALDWQKEPEHVKKLYHLDNIPASFSAEINDQEETIYFGRRCLIARRLLERGVRFIQVWLGNDNGFPRRNWDSHENIQRDHGPLALGMSRGIASFIADLRQRGLLDDTLILWTTEFGRMPSSQSGQGRDHNPFCFTNWLCGGGIKQGLTYGPSDDFGYKPVDRKNPTQVYDIHATMLHLLGIDHLKLTVRNNGIDRRLTDVHGHVIKELLA
ncbi:MAG TPA: DUF1501 domain-containing protein [Gemmatales bacterium]|nr:DUF1501 domain-containing protein [Gemmatales bacterium]